MPGSMFIQPSSLAALPTSGTAWNALVSKSNATPSAMNLGLLDAPQFLDHFSIAMRWAKDGGGQGRAFLESRVLAAVGTEANANQPLNPYRTLAVLIWIADLIDLDSPTFDNWVRSLPYKVVGGGSNANWDTLYKCSRVSGNNWGAFARPSLLACALWMIRRGLNPTGAPSGAPTTATGLRDATIDFYRRWCGDTSVPNTFTPSNAFDPNKDGPSTSYPTGQGVLNPASSDGLRDGMNCEDASRDAALPPTSSGVSYQYEALDGCASMIIMLINAGYTNAAGYGNNGVRRNVEWMIRNNRTTPDQNNYRHEFWMQPAFWNYLYQLSPSFPIPSGWAADRYQRRQLTTHTDWLGSGGSTWLKTSSDTGGGGTPTPAPVVNPNVSFTLTRSGQTLTVNAGGTQAGSAPIARHEIWRGNGNLTSQSPDLTLTEPSRSASWQTTPPPGGATYTVTVKAVATDGGTATTSQQVTVPSSDGAPVAQFTLTPTTGVSPLTVSWDFTGSFDPDGDTMTRTIVWGDGTTTNSAAVTGTKVFTGAAETTAYSVSATVSAGSLTSSPVVRTVTVAPAASTKAYHELWIGTEDGPPEPVLPAYESEWNGRHVRMGGYRLWVDATGDLRIKNGAPISDTDGVVVGTQT